MFKSKIAVILGTLIIGTSTASMAVANTSSTSINISAVVPSTEFQALPTNPNFGQAEVLAYNPTNSSLGGLSQRYTYKSTAGAIKAFIEGGASNLYNGNSAQNIQLTTKFNNVVLTGTAQEVVAQTLANSGGSADLTITPGPIPSGASGNYDASFTVIFESTAP